MAAIMSRMPELAERVDAFVSEHIDVLRESRAFFALPRIDVEVRLTILTCIDKTSRGVSWYRSGPPWDD